MSELEKATKAIVSNVAKCNLPARLLLGRLRLLDDSMRRNWEFTDNRGMPFYYYLGREMKPRRIVCVGGNLGLEAACCVMGADASEVVLCEQQNGRFAIANVKIAGAKVSGESNWDLGLVFSNFYHHFDSIWQGLTHGGHLCAINARRQLVNFAKIKNRAPIFVKARDEVGLMKK